MASDITFTTVEKRQSTLLTVEAPYDVDLCDEYCLTPDGTWLVALTSFDVKNLLEFPADYAAHSVTIKTSKGSKILKDVQCKLGNVKGVLVWELEGTP